MPEESFIEHPLIADCWLGSFWHCTTHPRNHLVQKQQQPPFPWLSQYHKSRMSICTNERTSSHLQTYNTNQCTLISLRTGSPCLDASFRAIKFPHSVPLQKQEQIYSCSIWSIRSHIAKLLNENTFRVIGYMYYIGRLSSADVSQRTRRSMGVGPTRGPP